MKKIIFFFLIIALAVGWYIYTKPSTNAPTNPPNSVSGQNPSATLNQPAPNGQANNQPTSNSQSPTGPDSTTPATNTIVETMPAESSEGMSLYYKKDYAKAIETLGKELQSANNESDRAKILTYIAKSYQNIKQPEQALYIYNQLVQQFPQNVYTADAYYFFAQQAEQQKNNSAKLQNLEKSALVAGNNPVGAYSALVLGDEYLAQDKAKAWLYYSKAMHGELNTAQRQKIKATLDAIVAELRYQPDLTGCITYNVRSGDVLKIIAKKHGTSMEFILDLNHKNDPNKLRINETLKIIPQGFKIEVYKASHFLVVYLDNGLYYQSYEVGLGKEDRTPSGNFFIKNKEKNPNWFYTDEQGRTIKIPYGDKRHAIGTRWMGFESQGIGIHGTIDPSSIGKNMSNGCVRLRNEDVERLFDLIATNTPVLVR